MGPRLARDGARALLAHPPIEPELDPISGLYGIRMRTSFKNIFVAGPAVMPRLGIEDEYYSALWAADACFQLAGSGVNASRRSKSAARRAEPAVAGAGRAG